MLKVIVYAGSLSTLFLVAFIWCWVREDFRTAVEVVGFVIGSIAAALAVVLLWYWIATAVTA